MKNYTFQGEKPSDLFSININGDKNNIINFTDNKDTSVKVTSSQSLIWMEC